MQIVVLVQELLPQTEVGQDDVVRGCVQDDVTEFQVPVHNVLLRESERKRGQRTREYHL